MYTTIFKFKGKTYSAKLVAMLYVEDDVCDLYVDEPQHIALLVKDDKVINTEHLDYWQQDILVKTDKDKKDMAKAGKVIDSFRKGWKI